MSELVDSLTGEAQRLRETAGEGIAAACANLQESLSSLRDSAQSGLEQSWQGLATLAEKTPRPNLNIPPLPPRLRDRLKIWSAKGIYTRATLNSYWESTFAKLRHGRLFAINPFSLGINVLRDVKLSTAFTLHLVATKAK